MEDTFENKLVDLVEKHILLYNPNLPEYKRKDLKAEVWNNIAQELNTDVKTCQKKWNSIKNAYNTALQKKPSGSGAGRKKAYTRDLSFLKEYAVLEESGPSSSQQYRISSMPTNATDADDVYEEIEYLDDEDLTQSTPTPTATQEGNTEIPDDVPNKLLKKIEEAWTQINDEKPDDVDNFCDTIKPSLRKFNSNDRLLMLCEIEIMKTIASFVKR